MTEAIETRVVSAIVQVLGLQEAKDLGPDTLLLGALPELDSLGIVDLAAELEMKFGFQFDSEDFNAQVFASVRSLSNFIAARTTGTVDTLVGAGL